MLKRKTPLRNATQRQRSSHALHVSVLVHAPSSHLAPLNIDYVLNLDPEAGMLCMSIPVSHSNQFQELMLACPRQSTESHP